MIIFKLLTAEPPLIAEAAVVKTEQTAAVPKKPPKPLPTKPKVSLRVRIAEQPAVLTEEPFAEGVDVVIAACLSANLPLDSRHVVWEKDGMPLEQALPPAELNRYEAAVNPADSATAPADLYEATLSIMDSRPAVDSGAFTLCVPAADNLRSEPALLALRRQSAAPTTADIVLLADLESLQCFAGDDAALFVVAAVPQRMQMPHIRWLRDGQLLRIPVNRIEQDALHLQSLFVHAATLHSFVHQFTQHVRKRL